MCFFDLDKIQPNFSKTESLPEYIHDFFNYAVNKYKLEFVYKTMVKLFYKQTQKFLQK